MAQDSHIVTWLPAVCRNFVEQPFGRVDGANLAPEHPAQGGNDLGDIDQVRPGDPIAPAIVTAWVGKHGGGQARHVFIGKWGIFGRGGIFAVTNEVRVKTELRGHAEGDPEMIVGEESGVEDGHGRAG